MTTIESIDKMKVTRRSETTRRQHQTQIQVLHPESRGHAPGGRYFKIILTPSPSHNFGHNINLCVTDQVIRL